MTRQVFDNAQTAHVWAQGRQESGRSSNGNFFFEGPVLYSYGPHFAVAYRFPEGRAIVNADSYSISTSRHTRYAWNAVRRAESCALPGLTEVAKELESARRFAQYSPATEEGRAQVAERRKSVQALLERQWIKGRDSLAGYEKAISWILESLGVPAAKAAAKAARIVAAQGKAEEAAKAAKARAIREESARYARAFAARPLAETLAYVDSIARDVQPLWAGRKSENLSQVYELKARAREAYRGAKEAKARGWTRVATQCRAHWRALNAGANEAARRAEARALQQYGKERLSDFRGYEALLAGRALPEGFKAEHMDWRLQSTGRALQQFAESRYVAAVSVFGFDGKALAARIRATGEALEREARAIEAKARKANARAEARRLVTVIRAGLHAAQAHAQGEALSLAAVQAVQTAMLAVAPLGTRFSTPKQSPRPFRIAGITPARFETWAEELRETHGAMQEQEQALRLAAWRDGLPGGAAPAHTPEGGVYLRARGVVQDSNGAITGGELQTSRGAAVPLTHALRAFRFLKLCREKGEGWKANGKTLSVGHFRIDSVTPEGDFTAGCHYIEWAEVAALAARLGVQELAAADTRESAHAHA